MISSQTIDSIFFEIDSTSNTSNRIEFLNLVVQTICDYLGLYFVGLYFVDSANNAAVLNAGSGAIGQRLISLDHKVPIGIDRSYGWQAGTAIGLDEIRLTNWEAKEVYGYSLPSKDQTELGSTLRSQNKISPFCSPALPLTKSELFLPLRVQEQTIGVLEIDSVEVFDFSSKDIMTLQLLADRIAIYISGK